MEKVSFVSQVLKDTITKIPMGRMIIEQTKNDQQTESKSII